MKIKTLIGKWNKHYSVYLNKSKDKYFWTVEEKGKIHNTFNDADSFGHWIFHSGFKPAGAK